MDKPKPQQSSLFDQEPPPPPPPERAVPQEEPQPVVTWTDALVGYIGGVK